MVCFPYPFKCSFQGINQVPKFDQPFRLICSTSQKLPFSFISPPTLTGRGGKCSNLSSIFRLVFLGFLGKEREKGNFLPSLHRFVYDQIQNNGIFAHERI